MINSRVLLAGALLATAGAANAAVTVTPTVVSNYDFRGISQTGEEYDPAFQLGVNYAHDSGFYIGLWGSNVDFGPGDPSVEVDVFTGFAGGDAKETVGYDVGINFYTYVSESDLNFAEIYAGLSKGPISAKLWYAWDFGGLSSKNAFYLEGNGTFPLGESGFSALAHVGYSFGDYWSDGDGEYFDWAVGVSKAFGNFTVSVKFVDGSDYSAYKNAKYFNTGSKAWASVSTTLPWAK